ncbi:MAG: hypothetical protein A3F11_03880 [Gammaproteobacteria bacterium RIFCSPHIGHO2_12_FULL_37_14]|nr:MAG: hypothetical protein A3F11_03880 [Gammaproteobacteria bacterium RIFCSPHIGHO2_12_FULL_37_14]
MLSSSLLFNFFNKKPVHAELHSSLHLLKSSYVDVKNSSLHDQINLNDLKSNGFLSSNDEKKKYLFYMAFHDREYEKISNKSPLNINNPGAVLINRNRQTIYKIYRPETDEEKCSRKELLKDLGIKHKPRGVIGQGAFGKICICQNLITGQWHAVKIIKKSYLEQLNTEIGLNTLYQPNEIEFLKQQKLFVDLIETSDKFYIIEKLIDGTSLIDYFQEIFSLVQDDNKKIIEDFFKILKKTVIAVAHFHQNDCLHRDISPGNFIYDDKEDKMYLIDFGFSIKLPHGYRGIYKMERCGNKEFMAIEITEKGLYSYASDIFALGKCITWFIDMLPTDMKDQFKFISEIEKLATDMTDSNRHFRPSLSYLYHKITLMMEKAIEEEKNMEKVSYPWQAKNLKLIFTPKIESSLILPHSQPAIKKN